MVGNVAVFFLCYLFLELVPDDITKKIIAILEKKNPVRLNPLFICLIIGFLGWGVGAETERKMNDKRLAIAIAIGLFWFAVLILFRLIPKRSGFMRSWQHFGSVGFPK